MQSSFSATLRVGETSYKVLSCEYLFYQGTDALGNAVAQVRSGELTLVLEGSADVYLMSWAASPLRQLSGDIIFFQGDQLGGEAERLAFEDGSCISYTELFEPHNPIGSYLFQLRIVANQLTLNGLQHINDWPDYL